MSGGSRKAFDRKLDDLSALREIGAASAEGPLRKALADRTSGFYVSKAAALAEEFRLHALTPDLLAAFNRFFANPSKTDPQCWAKNALVSALHALEYRPAAPYLR